MILTGISKGKSVTVVAAAVVFSMIHVISMADWRTIDAILTEAFGSETARQCREYYGELEIPDEQAGTLQEAVKLIVEAGYPEGCPREYLKLAADLSKAGIGLGDLTNKIREGIAKQVDPARLIHVLKRRAEALKEGRVLTLQLEQESVRFLDRQMAYTVFADYLLRGVKGGELTAAVKDGRMEKYPALDNVIR